MRAERWDSEVFTGAGQLITGKPTAFSVEGGASVVLRRQDVRRLEGTHFEPEAHGGKRGPWIFTASQVEKIYEALRERTGWARGPGSSLWRRSVGARAARWGRSADAGQMNGPPADAWPTRVGFTREEVMKITIWVKRTSEMRRRAVKVKGLFTGLFGRAH